LASRCSFGETVKQPKRPRIDDVTGFIRLNGLPLRVNSTVNGAKNLKAL
jgi:hypothetical protein